MSKKQNLDKLFQQKFQDIEVMPDASVWNAIDANLKLKKSKQKYTSNWLKFSGIAAVFLLSGLAGLYESNPNFINQSIIFTKSSTSKKDKNSQANNLLQKRNAKFNLLPIKTTDQTENAVRVAATNTKNEITYNVALSKSSKDVFTKDEHKVRSNHSLQTYNSSKTRNKLKLANTKFKTDELVLNDATNAIDTSKSPQIQHYSKGLSVKSKNSSIDFNNKNQATLNFKNDQENANVQLINNDVDKSNPNLNINSFTDLSSNKDTLFDSKAAFDVGKVQKLTASRTDNTIAKALLQMDSLLYKKNLDSTKLATVEINKLERLLNEKEMKKSEQKVNRWQVVSNIAPIYFGSMSNGSPLDKKFEDNEKSYLTSQSYGVGINYATSSKIKVRLGINLINLDYDTNNIAYSMNSNGAKLTNLNSNAIGRTMSIGTIKNVSIYGRSATAAVQDDTSFTGALNQKMSYIEVPLEMAYKVGTSKFNIDLITGFSTFYLQQNSVFLKTQTETIKIGEASNLNQIHFSGNIGLGLNYSVIKNFSVSVEPTFKYQVNTFSSNAGNFKPYVFGLYSGVKYSF